MNLRTASIDDVCDAILDASLSQEERWSIDRRMVRDSNLARAVVVQQKIRESLETSFEVPDLDRLVQAVAQQAHGLVDPARQDPTELLVDPDARQTRSEASRAGVLFRCAALLLVLCCAFWNVGASAGGSAVVGSPEWARRIESHLSEAVVLGVVGAAALAGSRRVARGSDGRFTLEQGGFRLVLPERTQEAIAMYLDGGNLALVLRMPSGGSAIVVTKPEEASRSLSSEDVYRRSVGPWELFAAGEAATDLLPQVVLEPIPR